MPWKLFVACLACALALPFAPAHAANAELNAEVAAGQTRALRLRQLPERASIGLRIEAAGPIRVIFVHENGLKPTRRAAAAALFGDHRAAAHVPPVDPASRHLLCPPR